MPSDMTRRDFVVGSLAVGAAATAASGEPAKAPAVPAAPAAPAGAMPKGKIGEVEFSRLMLGGNLLNGCSHSRDLRYVGQLAKRYNTDDKVAETLRIAEDHGIDSVNVAAWDNWVPLQRHRAAGGKMKWVVAANPDANGEMTQVQEVIRRGADVVYIQGVVADRLVQDGKVDLIAKEIQFIRSNGKLAGVGAHCLEVIVACEKAKIDPDFYQKTLHAHNYPSAPKPGDPGSPQSQNEFGSFDNSWCHNPQEVIAYMKDLAKPWIAFKVMAAGAIPPKPAFEYAFKNGADFVLAGMFDWQVAENARIAREVLANLKRERPWRA